MVGIASTAEDLQAKLALEPEAVVVEPTAVFEGPQQFAEFFSGFGGAVFCLLPSGLTPQEVEEVRSLPAVADVFDVAASLPAVRGRIYEVVQQRREAAGFGAQFQARSQAGRTTGWRSIGVWSPQGGVGKSTIAAALALESAHRGIPTLLVGLGAPDVIPLTLGLQAEPNVYTWSMSPNTETLRAGVQKADVLDVLAGFQTPLQMHRYKDQALEGNASLPSLASTAGFAGYAVVVFDVSSQELAPAALAAINTLVVVARPTLAGLANTASAIQTLYDVLADRHKIAAVHLVLNRVRPSTMSPGEYVRAGKEVHERFPPLAAVIPDDPAIEEAEQAQRPGYYASEPLRKAVRTLGDLVLALPAPSAGAQEARVAAPARTVNLGPIRIKMS